MAGSRESVRQLNGRQVSQTMYDAARTLKQRGAKVYLTVPGALPVGMRDEGTCPNCGGVGTLYLEYVTGGPYDSPPAHKSGVDSDGKRTDEPNQHPAWENGKWWRMTMTGFPCVVCHGGAQSETFRVAEIAL